MTHIALGILGILGIILLLNSLNSKMDFLNTTAPYKNHSGKLSTINKIKKKEKENKKASLSQKEIKHTNLLIYLER